MFRETEVLCLFTCGRTCGEGYVVGGNPTISAAARHLNGDNESIRRAVKDNNRTSAGYKWKAVSAEEFEQLEVVAQVVAYSGSRGTKVKMIDPNSKTILAVFDNCNAAARVLGLNKRSISSIVGSDTRKSSGFFWAQAADEDVVEVAVQEANIERAKKQKRSRK